MKYFRPVELSDEHQSLPRAAAEFTPGLRANAGSQCRENLCYAEMMIMEV